MIIIILRVFIENHTFMVITFNYKDGSKTITFEEIENTMNGSDLTAFGAPGRVFIRDFTL